MQSIFCSLFPMITPLFTAMNVTTADYEGFDQLHNMCSDAFGDISCKVEADSDNGIDDDDD
ncbi:MAG: hypothetical protein WBX01_07715 [Nitrososphaeraceae archaeon]